MSDWFSKFTGSLAANMPGMEVASAEHKKFLSSGYKCPGCGETLSSLWGALINIYDADGEPIPLLKARLEGKFAECRKCNHRWKLRKK